MKVCYRFIKRSSDILFSSIGLVGTLPLWIIAMIGIEISDAGPVFYMADRVGKDNRRFKMLKFRTMRQDVPNESVFRGEESRIFPFGKVLRDLKIDEIPQLVNILIGDMSIVGPRPAAESQLEVTRGGKYAAVSKTAAGLTGPSALYDYLYGDKIEDNDDYIRLVLPTRLGLDLVYMEKMSIGFDAKMILWTVIAIVYALAHKTPDWMLKQLVEWVHEET